MALSVPYSPISPRQRSGAGGGATACPRDAIATFDAVKDCDQLDEPKTKTIAISTAIFFVDDILVRSNFISIFGVFKAMFTPTKSLFSHRREPEGISLPVLPERTRQQHSRSQMPL